MRQLEFGWFLPTAGDTTAYADRDADVPPSLEMFDRIVAAAEAAGSRAPSRCRRAGDVGARIQGTPLRP